MKIVLELIIVLFIGSSMGCNSQKQLEELRSGTFSLIEDSLNVGYIYRLGNYQIEKYGDIGDYLEAEIKWIDKNKLLINGTEKIKVGVDTITWLAEYDINYLNDNTFDFRIKPAYIDSINYTYFGSLVKISDSIPSHIEKLLNK